MILFGLLPDIHLNPDLVLFVFLPALLLNIPSRDVLIASTYAVVLFTLLVQGFSLRWILKRLPLEPG